LCRKAPAKPRLTIFDRLIFVWLYRLRPSVISAITIVWPETVVRCTDQVSVSIGAGNLAREAVGRQSRASYDA
jgi:hypothetical protein